MTAGKRRLIIPAVLGALWLCAFALLVATESRSMIRENTAEITAECQTLWTLVKDAAAGNTADAARIAAYQQAMAENGLDEANYKNFTEEQKKEFEKNFKLDDDPRITKIGGFLRKTSLDELPQLLNIIKGDMSVVGPRPIVRAEVEKYGVCADKLFSVKPGLTGFWQANGRSDTTYEERVQMDMYYIDNRSFLLDIRIILKTVISVIRKEGAV